MIIVLNTSFTILPNSSFHHSPGPTLMVLVVSPRLSDLLVFHLHSFFNKVTQLAKPGYLPDSQDILRSRVRTTGIHEQTFIINDVEFVYVILHSVLTLQTSRTYRHCCTPSFLISYQGGGCWRTTQRAQEVDSLLRRCNSGDFFGGSQCLRPGFDGERQRQSLEWSNRSLRTHRELQVWWYINGVARCFHSFHLSLPHIRPILLFVNSFFQKPSMILFLNKDDLFRERIQTKDLRSDEKGWFTDYDGGCDETAAYNYIENKFLSKCRDKKKQVWNSRIVISFTIVIWFVDLYFCMMNCTIKKFSCRFSSSGQLPRTPEIWKPFSMQHAKLFCVNLRTRCSVKEPVSRLRSSEQYNSMILDETLFPYSIQYYLC